MQTYKRAIRAGVLVLMCTPGFALAQGGSDSTMLMSLRNNASLHRGVMRPTQGNREQMSETMKRMAVQLQAGSLTPEQAKQLSETLSHMADMLEK